MIISHKHKYLFIEIPLTASWAIHLELLEFYDGETILHKHATYPEFKRTKEYQEDYFVFATIRHPLDCAVSEYFKMITNHKGAFSNPRIFEKGYIDRGEVKKYQYILKEKPNFESYFHQFKKWPYSSMIDLSANAYSFLIHYEDLQAGFSQVLEQLGINQVRPIPVKNKTHSRNKEWQSYYQPGMFERTGHIYGPFMDRWDYEFPQEWGDIKVRKRDYYAYQALGWIRRIYMTQFRFKSGPLARAVRNLKAFINPV